MNVYELTVPQFKKTLGNLDKWLEAAVAFAQKKSFDANTLLVARLAPDQFPLARQVQSACDAAKRDASLLAGREPPKHPDTEQTIEELHVRIRTCTEYLDTLPASAFEGAETRDIRLYFLPGKVLTGRDFLVEMALPNFYFHVTTAYAILRHNGVELGKRDYLGGVTMRDG